MTHYSAERSPNDLDLELEPDLEAAGDGQVQWPAAPVENEASAGGDHMRPANDNESNNEVAEQLLTSQRDKARLQQELSDALRGAAALESDVSALQEALTAQQEKYSALQREHVRELDEMRQAGQQALTLIVDEYKELCKTAVLEVQHGCRAQVLEAIEQEREKLATLLHKQAEDAADKLEAERVTLKEHVTHSVTEQLELTQTEIDSRVAEARTQLESHITDVLQSERCESERLIDKSVEQKAENLQTALQQEQVRLSSFYDDEREKLKRDVTQTLADESARGQARLLEAVATERERGARLSADVIDKAQHHVTAYLEQHKQRDVAVRKKSLASIELFLCTAQKQLHALINAEPNTDQNTDKTDAKTDNDTDKTDSRTDKSVERTCQSPRQRCNDES